jgi:hypothetical protein
VPRGTEPGQNQAPLISLRKFGPSRVLRHYPLTLFSIAHTTTVRTTSTRLTTTTKHKMDKSNDLQNDRTLSPTLNEDDAELTALGYKPSFRREFSNLATVRTLT